MSFDPQNDLERSLIQAVNDPAHRPQFYRDFLESTVFVIQHAPPPLEDRAAALERGTDIQILNVQHNGKTHIPVFSSLPRLSAVLSEEVAYLGVPVAPFLKLTKGMPLLLNPGSDYGKEFSEPEIAALMDGSMWEADEHQVVTAPRRVMIGEPANYPHELVEALSRLFSTMPSVKRAWLAQYFQPGYDEKPHSLIGVEHTGDWPAIVGPAGVVARNVIVPDPPVDFFSVTDATKSPEGIEDYFRDEIEPFYPPIV